MIQEANILPQVESVPQVLTAEEKAFLDILAEIYVDNIFCEQGGER